MRTSLLKNSFISLMCAAVILATLPGAALAQTPSTPTPNQAGEKPLVLGIASIEPTQMRSDEGGALTVLGTDFDSTAVVRLQGIGVLATTFVNTTTLTALVPRGLAPATYTVEVRNGAGETSTFVGLTITPGPTPTPEPQPTDIPPPAPFVRPLMTVATFRTTPNPVVQGKVFTLTTILKNVGDDTAFNIAMRVPAGDFVPSGNAGTLAFPKLKPGESLQFDQALIAKFGIGNGLKTVEAAVSYNDRNGGSYNDTLPLGISVAGGGGPARTPTPTPLPPAPQLVVTNYRTEPVELRPGTIFTLSLDIDNVGQADAARLSAVLGGAASSGDTGGDGTGNGGSPGGVSGGGGDFDIFGPIGSSNVKFIDTLTPTETATIEQNLIVNSTAEAGAYTVKVSLVYDDPGGKRRIDDQVITLIVVQPPAVEISYYRSIDPAFAGQPWPMPVQVVNVGRNTAQLGRMEVLAPEGVDVQNGSVFVGPLESGGQFPIDALVTPLEPGPLTLTVNVHYIDDFNAAKVISATLDVEVLPFEPPPVEPGSPEPGVPPPTEESFFDMLVRAFLGLIGLDSGRPAVTTGPIDSGISPPVEGPIEGPVEEPVPIKP